MSIDFLADLFGKARRRKLEAAAAQVFSGGGKPVAIDYGVLGTKFAAAATGYLLLGTLNHTLPATSGGILTGVGAAIIAAGPSALQSSGVFTALSPNTVSAIKGLGSAIGTVLAAPANAKKAAFQTAVKTAVAVEVNAVLSDPERLTKTGLFGPGELASPPVGGLASPLGAGGLGAAPTPQTAPEAAVSGEAAIPVSTAAEDAGLTTNSILITGGNQ